MEVILREDIKTLGKAGDLVKVKPGYARNFLLPKGLAYEATDGNRKRIASESKARLARVAEERSGAEAVAAKLAAAPLALSRKAGEGASDSPLAFLTTERYGFGLLRHSKILSKNSSPCFVITRPIRYSPKRSG